MIKVKRVECWEDSIGNKFNTEEEAIKSEKVIILENQIDNAYLDDSHEIAKYILNRWPEIDIGE